MTSFTINPYWRDFAAKIQATWERTGELTDKQKTTILKLYKSTERFR